MAVLPVPPSVPASRFAKNLVQQKAVLQHWSQGGACKHGEHRWRARERDRKTERERESERERERARASDDFWSWSEPVALTQVVEHGSNCCVPVWAQAVLQHQLQEELRSFFQHLGQQFRLSFKESCRIRCQELRDHEKELAGGWSLVTGSSTERERERERDRERQGETERDRERPRETERDRERQRETERDRERQRETERDRERQRERERGR